eukprot:scaffold149385_cov113-Cyclotella_meneghiniana.AAC.1
MQELHLNSVPCHLPVASALFHALLVCNDMVYANFVGIWCGEEVPSTRHTTSHNIPSPERARVQDYNRARHEQRTKTSSHE